MKITLPAILLGIAALVAPAMADCAKSWTPCDADGEKRCECNGGHIEQCIFASNEAGIGEYWWMPVKNCPKNEGRLQCIDGHCN